MWHTMEVSYASHARRTKKPACMTCRKAKRKCGINPTCERSQLGEDKGQGAQPTSSYRYEAGLGALDSVLLQPSGSTMYTHEDSWSQSITADRRPELYHGSGNPYLFYATYQEGFSSGPGVDRSDREPRVPPLRDGVTSQLVSHVGVVHPNNQAIERHSLTHIAVLASQTDPQMHMHTVEETGWRSAQGFGFVSGLPHESQVSHGQEWLEVFASSLSPRGSAVDSTGASAPHPPGPFPESFCKDENEDAESGEHCGLGEPYTAKVPAISGPSSKSTQGSLVSNRTVASVAASALVSAGRLCADRCVPASVWGDTGDLMERAFDGLCSGIANMRLHDRLDPDKATFIANGIKYLFSLSGGSFASPRFVEALEEAARPMRSKRRKVYPGQLTHELTHKKAVDELLATHATLKSSEDWILELLRTPGSAGAYFAISSSVNLVEKIIFNPLMETLFTTVDELSSAAYQLRSLNSFIMARHMHPECVSDFYAAMIRCLGTSDVGSELESSCLVQMYTRQGLLLPCLATVRWHWDEAQSLVSMRFWPMSNLMDPRLGMEPPPELSASSLDPVITRMVERGFPSPSSSSSCLSVEDSSTSTSEGAALPCFRPPPAQQKSSHPEPPRAYVAETLAVGPEPGAVSAISKKDAPLTDGVDDEEVLQVLMSFLPEFQ